MTPYETLFEGIERPPKGAVVIDPFAGDGSLLKWLGEGYITLGYDKEPTQPRVLRKDCIANRPNYAGSYVIAEPPWTPRADEPDNPIFQQLGVDNLYKAFIRSLIKSSPLGGIIIVPLSFLVGTRDSERARRKEFFSLFKPLRFNVSEQLRSGQQILVIHFIARTFYIGLQHKAEEDWLINFLSSAEQRILTIVNQNYQFLPGEYEFTKMFSEKPTKRIEVRCTESSLRSSPATRNEGIVQLRLQRDDTPEQRAGLYTTESGGNIILRGAMSRRLCHRLATDFNTWLEDWRLSTNSLYMLPAHKPPHKHLSTVLALEAIKRILWSYYLVKKPTPRKSP